MKSKDHIKRVIQEIQDERMGLVITKEQEECEKNRSAHREVFIGCGEYMDQLI